MLFGTNDDDCRVIVPSFILWTFCWPHSVLRLMFLTFVLMINSCKFVFMIKGCTLDSSSWPTLSPCVVFFCCTVWVVPYCELSSRSSSAACFIRRSNWRVYLVEISAFFVIGNRMEQLGLVSTIFVSIFRRSIFPSVWELLCAFPLNDLLRLIWLRHRYLTLLVLVILLKIFPSFIVSNYRKFFQK